MKRAKKSSVLRRALTGIAGTAAGIGVLLGGVFDTAEDLLPDEERRAGKTAASTAVLREEAPSAAMTKIPLPQELTRTDRLRLWIWQLPAWVRGAVLLPWSAVRLLQGDSPRALGLAGIWVTVSVVRSVLEPKLLGRELGLDPLVTLMALYAGYKLMGIPGLILAPLLTVTALQLLPER